MKHYDLAHFRPHRSGQEPEFRLSSSAFGASIESRVLPDPESSQNLAEFYRFALDEAAIVAITDAKGIILSANAKFCETSGYTADELIGQNHRILQSGIHDRAFFRNLYKTIGSGRVWRGQICNRSKSGRSYWVDTTIVPHRSASGRIDRFIAIRFDITHQDEVLRLAALQTPVEGLGVQRRQPGTGNVRQIQAGGLGAGVVEATCRVRSQRRCRNDRHAVNAFEQM